MKRAQNFEVIETRKNRKHLNWEVQGYKERMR